MYSEYVFTIWVGTQHAAALRLAAARQLAQQLSGWSQLAASWHTGHSSTARKSMAASAAALSSTAARQFVLQLATRLGSLQLGSSQRRSSSLARRHIRDAPALLVCLTVWDTPHLLRARFVTSSRCALCPCLVLVPVLSTSHVLTLVISCSPVSECRVSGSDLHARSAGEVKAKKKN